MEAMVDYKTKDYPSAILKFRALLPYPHDSNLQAFPSGYGGLFLPGFFLYDGRSDTIARTGCSAGSSVPEGLYPRLAQWYEALTCLRLGRRAEADSFLVKIASDPTHPYREKAMKLAKELEELPHAAYRPDNGPAPQAPRTFALCLKWLGEAEVLGQRRRLRWLKTCSDRLPQKGMEGQPAPIFEFIPLYILPGKAADSALLEAESMLDPSLPSYSNDLLVYLNGKTRWMLTSRRLAVQATNAG